MNVIVAVLMAVGFAVAVARHVRYVSPEKRQAQRIADIIKAHGKRDVGPVGQGYRTLPEQIDLARQHGVTPPDWPYAATTTVTLDDDAEIHLTMKGYARLEELRHAAEEAARLASPDHPRDDEGRLT